MDWLHRAFVRAGSHMALVWDAHTQPQLCQLLPLPTSGRTCPQVNSRPFITHRKLSGLQQHKWVLGNWLFLPLFLVMLLFWWEPWARLWSHGCPWKFCHWVFMNAGFSSAFVRVCTVFEKWISSSLTLIEGWCIFFDIKFFSLIVVQIVKPCRNYLFLSKFCGNKYFLSMFNEFDEYNNHLQFEFQTYLFKVS